MNPEELLRLGKLIEENNQLKAENKRLAEALEIVKANSLNPAHTVTKLGLEEIVDANYNLADKILSALPSAEGKEVGQ